MAQYSVHFLNREKRLVRLAVLECGTDQEASRKAAALADDATIELWRDNRRLGRFNRQASKKTAASQPFVLDSPIQSVLEDALSLHRGGQFAEAAKKYANVLRANNDNAQAMTLLGTLQAQQGNLKKAVALLNRSLEIESNQPFALNSLGNALNSLDRHDEALAAFDKAIALKPDQAATYSNGGNALRGLKRHREALAAYRRAITIDPTYAEAHSNRADLLLQLKRYDDAVASYDRAIALRPDSMRDWIGRALALQEANRPEQAVESYDRVIALKSDLPDAWNNRGNALAKLQRYDEALKNYATAIHLKPDYAAAHCNRGNVLRALRRNAEAVRSYDRAIAAYPRYAAAHHNRGNALKSLGRTDEALASYDAAIRLAPKDAASYFKKCVVLRETNRFEEALGSIDKALRLDPELPYALGERLTVKLRMCDWNGLSEACAAVTSAMGRGSRAAGPFSLIAIEGTPSLQRQCAEIYVRDKYPPQMTPEASSTGAASASKERIRVAYLSADFRSHATAYLIAGVFELHDRSHFEVYAISFGKRDGSEMCARMEKACEHFIDVSDMSDREVAALLRELEVDIAVDLKGFTKDARTGILAYRPAPIQVNYLGYPGTMGAAYIDYLIADKILVPEAEQASYSEQIVYLPDTYQCNDSKRTIAETVPRRSEIGLPETGFVFCSFNNSYKITPGIFDIWMRLLKHMDGSVLWLLESNPATARNLRQEAEARGVARERLIFAPWCKSQADHLARLRLADLFLDTLPCCAHTTASDALWAGLPVLTCMGNTFAGRVAASLLNAVGLPDMVTYSPEEYEARALTLARSPMALAAVRQQLARNRLTQPLFDTIRFTQHMEAAYTTMVERHRAGGPPVGFAVARRAADFANTDRS